MDDLVIAILVVLAVLAGGAWIYDVLRGRRRRRRAATYVGDAANQLRIVMNAEFQKKRLMSKAEFSVFRTIEELLRDQHRGYRVLCQTSLGEIIGSSDSLAFRSINSKRVDMLVLGPYGFAVAAVEYQGGEHYQGDAAARDAVKREALRRAGIDFIEVGAQDTADTVRRLVSTAIAHSETAPNTPATGQIAAVGRFETRSR